MAYTQTQYRTEFVAAFEQNKSLVLPTVTQEAQIKGNQAVFLVAGSGGNRAVTRGANGRIPASNTSRTPYTATLAEKHDKREQTNYDIFWSQSDTRRIMQDAAIAVINREMDQDIITELNTGTQDTGAATTASLSMAMYGLTILGNNAVPLDGNISALITPAFYAYLMQTKEFANVDYVNNKPFADTMTQFRWAGVNWIVHPNLPGAATTAEKCFMYHKTAIGYALDTAGIQTAIGYNEEDDYSFARATYYGGAKLLQNTGVVVL